MDVKEFTFSDLIIHNDSPRLPYKRRETKTKKAIHWGQRKLLLSEIQFFTLYWDPRDIPNPICVYAGAAPGIHIPFLSEMFPRFVFHLYDPALFEIKETDRIKLFNEYFTDEVANRYADRNDIFFVSDIRTTNYEEKFKKALSAAGITKFDNKGNPIGPPNLVKEIWDKANAVNEDQIWGDMNMQQDWVLMMNPEHALLKLRFPYSPDGSNINLNYLSGTVYWQIWPGPTSTETRLKPIRNARGVYEHTIWSNIQYEQWAFYHNTVERENIFYINPFFGNHDPIDYPELLNDYDSTAEAFVLSIYSFSQGIVDTLDVYQHVKMLSNSITHALNQNRIVRNSLSRKRKMGSREARPLSIAVRQESYNPLLTRNYAHTHIAVDSTWRDQKQTKTPTVIFPNKS